MMIGANVLVRHWLIANLGVALLILGVTVTTLILTAR